VREQRRAAVPHGEKAARPPIAKPGPKVPPWEAAWKEAENKAKSLISQQRFGEAMTTYEKLASRFEDPKLADRAQKAVFGILDQAKKAYQEAEKRAKQLLDEEKFNEARAALRVVIERFGVPGRKKHAEELIVEIDKAEKAEQARAAQAAKEAAEKAQKDRRDAERKKREAAEGRYAKALEPIEGMIGAWDFGGAAAALAKLNLGDIVTLPKVAEPSGGYAARLATRREEVGRLAKLKAKMIAKINTSKPRLQRRSLLIRGVNADLVKANEKGITAKLATGKTEVHTWGSLSSRSVGLLVQRSTERRSADDWLAAGILALTMKDPRSAERHFEKAREFGAKIDRYLDPLASAAFERARALLDEARGAETPRLQKQKKFAEAGAALANIEKKYGKTPWFASHKDGFAAAREAAKSAIAEAEAEKLYAQAVKLFRRNELFDLKPIVQKLEADYPKTQPVTDPDRKPSFTEMAKATENLGKFITVRKDGKGDFRTIQAAVDAAPPNSLIEIQDNGPYREAVRIGKPGITLRGRKGFWPVIASVAEASRDVTGVVAANAPRTTLQRVVVVSADGAQRALPCLRVLAGPLYLRSVILFHKLLGGRPRGSALSVPERTGASCEIENCVGAGSVHTWAPLVVRNSIWVAAQRFYLAGKVRLENAVLPLVEGKGPCELRFCTIPGHVKFEKEPNVFVDSIVRAVESVRPNTRIEYCDVFGGPAFTGLAKPGKRVICADPQFRDPKNLDYRLKPTSPCRKRASDGGDIGCRYTPEMLEMLKVALKLRRKGIIKF